MRGATTSLLPTGTGRIFLLTHLMRGATCCMVKKFSENLISTHAPHARCNIFFITSIFNLLYFYSRTSCEVQLFADSILSSRSSFLLTHLMRGATWGDTPTSSNLLHFYSRTSCEVQLGVSTHICVWIEFLLTHLMRGATR